MSTQTFTNTLQAPFLAGDFASVNPRATQLSSQYYGQAGFTAGPSGLTMGLFCWLDTGTYNIASNSGAGAPNGFVHRDFTALITTYVTDNGYTIPAGMMASCIYNSGDFAARNTGANIATPGMKAYANNTTGVVTFAAAGAPTTSGTSTASTIAATTFSVTASIVDAVMTVTAVGSGTVVAGAIISGTNVASGSAVVAQLTGTAGGVGTYTVTPRSQTVASTTVSGTYGLLTIGGTVAGTFAVSQTLTGAAAGTIITQRGTGVGAAGTYYVNLTQTVSSGTINSLSTIDTGWFCHSFAQPGEVAIISTRGV